MVSIHIKQQVIFLNDADTVYQKKKQVKTNSKWPNPLYVLLECRFFEQSNKNGSIFAIDNTAVAG